MARLITAQEFIFRMKRNLVATGKVSKVVVDRVGSDIDLLIGCFAAGLEANSRQNAHNYVYQSLSGKRGKEIDQWAHDHYGERAKRRERSRSFGRVRLVRATYSAGATTVNADSVAYLPGYPRIRVVLTESVSFGSTALGPLYASAMSFDEGSEFNAGVGTLSWERTPADSSIVASIDEQFVGGYDGDTDEQYIRFLASYNDTNVRGTLAAIQAGANTVQGVVNATAENVLEEVNGNMVPYGVVKLYLGDQNGASNEQIAASFPDAIEEYAPAGVAIIPFIGQTEMVSISVNPTFINTGRPTSVKRDLIKRSILSYVNSRRRYEPISPTGVAAAVLKVAGVNIEPEDILEPSGVLLPSSEENTFRTSMTRILVNGQ